MGTGCEEKRKKGKERGKQEKWDQENISRKNYHDRSDEEERGKKR